MSVGSAVSANCAFHLPESGPYPQILLGFSIPACQITDLHSSEAWSPPNLQPWPALGVVLRSGPPPRPGGRRPGASPYGSGARAGRFGGRRPYHEKRTRWSGPAVDITDFINEPLVSRVYCRLSVTADKSSRFLTYFTRSTSSASAGWIILIHVYAARSHAKKYSRSITCARVPSD